MRTTLVFLPPPSLSLFPTSASSCSTHHVRIKVARPPPRSFAPVPAVSQVIEVPDSVEPQQLLLDDGEQESIELSCVPDAPVQVPWELLYAPKHASLSHHSRGGRASKRARIKSPVLAIQTPERSVHSAPHPSQLHTFVADYRHPSFDANFQGDTSRVVLSQQSDQHNEASPRSLVALTPPRIEPIPPADHDAQQAQYPNNTAEPEADKSRVNLDHVSESDDQEDLTNTGVDTDSDTFALLPALGMVVTDDRTAASLHNERLASLSISACSLQIRPPIPAPTCRFTFFSKRPPLPRPSRP